MPDFLAADQFEALIHQRGFRVADVCRRAEVNRSIFARWKEGGQIYLRNYRLLWEALESLSIESKTE